MYHQGLINIAAALNYTSIGFDGVCKGFSGMWIQAVCLDESEVSHFNQRLQLLNYYRFSPKILVQDIATARKLIQQGAREPTQIQTMILEIPAFFDGIALYVKPDLHTEVWGDKILYPKDQLVISQYAQSTMLELQGGLTCVFKNTELYDKESLTHFLNTLNDCLQGRRDVGVELCTGLHSVAIRVLGKNSFQLADTNHLDKLNKTYTSEQLSKQLNTSFKNNPWYKIFSRPKPLVLYTSIYTSQSKPLISADRIRTNAKISSLICDKSRHILTHASLHDDVDTIKRLDFSLIDVNQKDLDGYTGLEMACDWNCNETINFLLEQPLINVNQGKFPPLRRLLRNQNYQAARQIINHPSFDSNISGANTLHDLALTKTVSDETLALAKELINKGVDVNQNNKYGNAAIYCAFCLNNYQLVRLLLEHGASPQSIIFSKNTSFKNCDTPTQIELLKKALAFYVKDRACKNEYLNFFKLGYSKSQKIRAAEALLDRLNGKDQSIQEHLKVLNNGRLSIIYRLSAPHISATMSQLATCSME